MLNKIEEALEDIKQGKMVIVVDDENRENEGDFIMAAELCTSEDINFMITHGRGLVCTPISSTIAKQFKLEPMVTRSEDSMQTAFTVSIDAKLGVTTGISAADRARVVNLLTDQNASEADIVAPGHIFPLIAKDGGVLTREGHTEAAVDLAELCGLKSAGVICEILNQDGTCARLPELRNMAQEFNLKLISIEDLVTYKKKLLKTVKEDHYEKRA
jgi:3,4-dihydroxy 2-butanone 4-phosphate synthase/GTP cyclohydrolase II